MKKYLLFFITSFLLMAMEREGDPFGKASEETVLVRSMDGKNIYVSTRLIQASGYLMRLYSASSGPGFNVDLTKSELDLLVSILQHPDIWDAIPQNLIDLIPFQEFTRREFFDLIKKFELSSDLFKKLWDLTRDYTILVGKNNYVYPVRNSDVNKIPLFKELEEDVPEKTQWFVSLAVPINTKIMQMIVALIDVSTFPIIKEKLQLWTTREIVALVEILDYFGLTFQTKVCFIILCAKEKAEGKKITFPVKSRIVITLQDLHELGILPQIQVIVESESDSEHQFLDLSGYGLSNINDILQYFSEEEIKELVILNLSYNRLRDFSKLPPMEKLMILDISYNNLQAMALEDWFKNTPLLTHLILNNNNIAVNEIESGWASNMKYLMKLDLSNNRILENNIFTSSWTLGLGGFTFLDPRDKKEKIGGGLKYLFLRNNGIKKLWAGWARGLTQLKELNLANNPIKELEPGWAQGLKNLTKIFIDKNLKSSIKNKINWELNGILAYFGIYRPKVTIQEVE